MPTRSGRPPTIRDVAVHAGVSKSLVSLVINDSPLVRPAKREAVEAAIRELGYRPNSAARRLGGTALRTVGVLVHDMRQPFHADMVEALNAGFHARDMTMLLGDAQLDRRADERVVNAFMNMRVDGLVLVGSMVSTEGVLEAVDRLPSVVVANLDLIRPRVDASVQDDVEGARLATEHLIGLGHRRIAHLSGTYGVSIGIRRDTYVETMRGAGLEPEVVVDDLTTDGAFRVATRLLGRPDRPTAIFCAADAVALGALRAAADLGLTVPGDVSVLGFDNTSLSRAPGIELSTVDIGLPEMAQAAIELLCDRIADRDRRRRIRRTAATVVPRRTTAPPA
ncbi:LacI family DNA-binding transcriptional regulator [Oryzobacter telluris]|uniref:LacI family DNA-binding transcriptional regulator n=1 Tax=Oryzobacter telluris TaxID=3149179 RepID=UPI00370D600C